ncbi:MAG: NAD(+) kinase [Legionellales bacterium]|nr:MAG: NAD(+) kinase [Legionellales bacterium]
MSTKFNNIAIYTKPNDTGVAAILQRLLALLQQMNISASQGNLERSDLIIVVGGDGSLLHAARIAVEHNIPIVGINKGRLGFLTDIAPDHFESKLSEILNGQYITEQRSLLVTEIIRNNKIINSATALNDVVLYTNALARMIDFEIYINNEFVLDQRADGLIIATPTGSTAYALSAGGPILYPGLQAITVLPILPHTLSSRPIAVADTSIIEITLKPNNASNASISCDGQIHIELTPGDKISSKKYHKTLQLLHPTDYDYFRILRQKLGWSTQAGSERYATTTNN